MVSRTVRNRARLIRSALLLGGLILAGSAVSAQDRAAPPGPFASDAFRTEYVRLGLRDAEALAYLPARPNGKGIALVYVHPSGNTFTEPLGREMAPRGYTVLMVNRHGDGADRDDLFGPAISQTIRYARSLPGISKVVLVGHSGGGHLAAFYQNVAENGPDACSGSELIYPCDRAAATGLARPDGLVLLDPTLGALHQANAIDPAAGASKRNAKVDMFAPANGYDTAKGSARYLPAFKAAFTRAQANRSMAITQAADARLKAIASGKGRFRDDEPLVIEGMGNMASGARLFQPDTSLLAHTQGRYVTLTANGDKEGPIVSVRPPIDSGSATQTGTLAQMTRNTTVRTYLATSAIRLSPDFSITADDIQGVDWRSAVTSTPGNAEGIKVPSLVVTMTCHYLVVPGEIIYRHLAATDKTLVAVEGATHLFAPCKPEYGDTMGRTFGAVDRWLSQPGRFQ